MGCELSHQIGLQLRQFLGQPSRNRLRSQLTRLPSLFQIAFEGGQRHAKQLHDLSSRAALVYRTHHSFPQIFRIRFHTSCSLSLLASRSFTYSITWLNSSASRCKTPTPGITPSPTSTTTSLPTPTATVRAIPIKDVPPPVVVTQSTQQGPKQGPKPTAVPTIAPTNTPGVTSQSTTQDSQGDSFPFMTVILGFLNVWCEIGFGITKRATQQRL